MAPSLAGDTSIGTSADASGATAVPRRTARQKTATHFGIINASESDEISASVLAFRLSSKISEISAMFFF
jgi:hypothetical protein